MIEFNLALPFLMPIILVAMMLIAQWGFIYSAKSTLDAATVNAARAGALNHGNVSEIRQGLAKGMTPLFAHGTSMSDTLTAVAKARAAVFAQSQITVLSPDRRTFNEFKIRARYNNRYIDEIPNNNLMYRSAGVKDVGSGRQMNIQDANLLQIEVRWCQKLIVPFANYVIEEIVTSVWYAPSREQLACNALGQITGDAYLALVSQGLTRMQTPFRM
ncbi:pilus assembly protein [Shewanella sp. WXL01]|uniref:Pilus assembly protein n=1 Tax=Shewanella maritima TaxID=2520507 RepID=A0A411PFZ5_9GAMM|nr:MULTISPECIES: TadE family protein [Shewanella]NKF49362.1 pilus assembly protein [Shewanella sp. WXL01]QBF82519.1 pilus assembly protein [Shewanella maritima]